MREQEQEAGGAPNDCSAHRNFSEGVPAIGDADHQGLADDRARPVHQMLPADALARIVA